MANARGRPKSPRLGPTTPRGSRSPGRGNLPHARSEIGFSARSRSRSTGNSQWEIDYEALEVALEEMDPQSPEFKKTASIFMAARWQDTQRIADMDDNGDHMIDREEWVLFWESNAEKPIGNEVSGSIFDNILDTKERGTVTVQEVIKYGKKCQREWRSFTGKNDFVNFSWFEEVVKEGPVTPVSPPSAPEESRAALITRIRAECKEACDQRVEAVEDRVIRQWETKYAQLVQKSKTERDTLESDCRRRISTLTADNERKVEDLTAEMNEKLRLLNEEHERELDAVRSQNSASQSDAAGKFKSRMTEMKRQMEALRMDNEAKAHKIELLTSQLQDSRLMVTDTAAQSSQAQSKLQQRLEGLRAELQKRAEIITQRDNEINQLRRENARLKEAAISEDLIDQLNREKAELRSQLQRVQENARSKISSLKEELNHMKTINARLQRELEIAQATAEQPTEIDPAAREKLREKDALIAELRREIVHTREIGANHAAELTRDFSHRVDELIEEIKVHEETIDKLQKEIEAFERLRDETEEMMEHLRGEVGLPSAMGVDGLKDDYRTPLVQGVEPEDYYLLYEWCCGLVCCGSACGL